MGISVVTMTRVIRNAGTRFFKNRLIKNLLKSQNYVTLMPDLNIPESMAIIMNKL